MSFFGQVSAFTCSASYLCFFVEHLAAMIQFLPASCRTTAPPIAWVCIYLKVEIILSRDEMVWNPQFGLSESPGVSNDARMSRCVCEAPIRLLLSAHTQLTHSFETFWICQE